MRQLLYGACATLALSLPLQAHAENVNIGVLLGFTGPIESLSPDMAAGAEIAINEVNNSGQFMNGMTINAVRGDSTCVDASAASATAERMITAEKVVAIMGADCSGVTTAVLQNVAIANGVVMISPSATSPGLSTVEDNGLFFRTSPSDARQGEVLADIMVKRGISSAAITYTNNDYGKGLADSISSNFEAKGGQVTLIAAHEDGKGDYSAEVAALAQAGGDVLVVAGYLDQGGKGVIQSALDSGAFDTFVLPDGMVGDSLVEAIGADLNGSFGSLPKSEGEGAALFANVLEVNAQKDGPYVAQSYDAAALIMLAMQASQSTNSQEFKDAVFGVANAPGVKIMPGNLAEGLRILAEGGEINYVGATDVELIGSGESAGTFAEIEIDRLSITRVNIYQ